MCSEFGNHSKLNSQHKGVPYLVVYFMVPRFLNDRNSNMVDHKTS